MKSMLFIIAWAALVGLAAASAFGPNRLNVDVGSYRLAARELSIIGGSDSRSISSSSSRLHTARRWRPGHNRRQGGQHYRPREDSNSILQKSSATHSQSSGTQTESGVPQSATSVGDSATGQDASVKTASAARTTSSSTASASSPASSASTDSSIPSAIQGTVTGEATYYYQDGVAGSCGTVSQDSDKVVAVKEGVMESSLCGKTVVITNTDNSKTVNATIMDTCPGCSSDTSLDLSIGAFDQIGEEATGILNISWCVSD